MTSLATQTAMLLKTVQSSPAAQQQQPRVLVLSPHFEVDVYKRQRLARVDSLIQSVLGGLNLEPTRAGIESGLRRNSHIPNTTAVTSGSCHSPF